MFRQGDPGQKLINRSLLSIQFDEMRPHIHLNKAVIKLLTLRSIQYLLNSEMNR